jgi:predicted transcriptional regulator
MSREISKRVEKAVLSAITAKKKTKDYNKLAIKLGTIAEKNNISISHLRAVSGIELNSIYKVLKYKEMKQEEQFIKAFNKLEDYDKQRVRDALNL